MLAYFIILCTASFQEEPAPGLHHELQQESIYHIDRERFYPALTKQNIVFFNRETDTKLFQFVRESCEFVSPEDTEV